jgi:hypothetical protein
LFKESFSLFSGSLLAAGISFETDSPRNGIMRYLGRFDIKHYFLTSSTSNGHHDLRTKRYKFFEGMWGPHGYAMPLSIRLKVAEY